MKVFIRHIYHVSYPDFNTNLDLSCYYEPQVNEKNPGGPKRSRRIRLGTRDVQLIEISEIENEAEKRIIKEQSKKNKCANLNDIYKQFRVRDDESICQVCNGGDYHNDNLIVFCEGCGVWVHQKWYGIETLPKHDWICSTCEVFGSKQAQYIQWALCPNKGGPMKPSNVLSSDDFLISTGTGIQQKFYLNKLKRYIREVEQDQAEAVGSIEAEGYRYEL
jgi:hypothetical protein